MCLSKEGTGSGNPLEMYSVTQKKTEKEQMTEDE